MLKARLIKRKRKGFSTIEAIEAIALFALMVTGLVTTILYAQEGSMLAGNRARAMLIAKEGMEAMRTIRDVNYNGLLEGTHGIAYENGSYSLTTDPDVNGIFTRDVQVYSVNVNNKDIRVTVTWEQNGQRQGTFRLDERLTNWRRTTETLPGDWSDPEIVQIFNTPGSMDAIKVAVKGDYAYVIRATAANSFITVYIPIGGTPEIIDQRTVHNNLSDIAICGNYAYLTSSHDSFELQVIDISVQTAPVAVGEYNAPGKADANSVQCQGTTVFVSRNFSFEQEFEILDASDPTNISKIGGCELNITSGYDMYVRGNTVYVASSFIVAPFNIVAIMTIIDITNLSAPSIINRYVEWSDWGGALSIAATGNQMFMGQGNPGNRVYAYDISTPTSPILKANVKYNGAINDMAIGRDNILLFVGSADPLREFVVFDITDPNNVHEIATMNMPGAINGLAYMAPQDMVASVTSANEAEIIIITSGRP